MKSINSIIIFDFDGVIADSFEGAYKINQLISPGITREQYAARFKGNINETHKSIKENSIQEFFSHWEPLVSKLPIFTGMPETIRQLAQTLHLAIISSTTSQPINEFLHVHNLHICFSHVLGNDVDHSKVNKINTLLKVTSTEPTAAVMVTDTLGDLKEAHQAGIHTIAVTWGFHDKTTLRQGNPTTIINHPHQLPPRIDKILKLKHSHQHNNKP